MSKSTRIPKGANCGRELELVLLVQLHVDAVLVESAVLHVRKDRLNASIPDLTETGKQFYLMRA
jgi:hypothetical protein